MVQEGITVQLFVGFPLTSLLRMHLNKSHSWQEEVLTGEGKLKKARHEEKDFIGLPTKANKLIIKDLKKIELNLKEKIQQHCPKLDPETLKISIIPQVFIA